MVVKVKTVAPKLIHPKELNDGELAVVHKLQDKFIGCVGVRAGNSFNILGVNGSGRFPYLCDNYTEKSDCAQVERLLPGTILQIEQ